VCTAIGGGPQDAARADLYAADFETIWDNQDPGLYVVDLPQAVRERLIEIAGSVANPKEIDGSSELPVGGAATDGRGSGLSWPSCGDAPRMPKGRLVGNGHGPGGALAPIRPSSPGG
jgi:hypothetical protein